MRKLIGLIVIASLASLAAACGSPADTPEEQAAPAAVADSPASTGSFTQGRATTVNEGLFECEGGRISAVGTITATDGTTWTVPADTFFESGPHAADLYNQCGGDMLASSADIDLDPLPITEIHADGEVITAYVFADNYFELYVDGTLVAIDPVPFTPFNSNVMRFRARTPFNAAVKLVDWEENLGLGTEAGRGNPFHPGDGGLVARFENEAGEPIGGTTDAWKALAVYIAPFADPACIVEDGPSRLSRDCVSVVEGGGESLHAVHWPIPEGWNEEGFDDSAWPQASTFTNDTVGVDNKPAYTNFPDIWDDPDFDPVFIWSDNLVLDNVVLVRGRVGS